MQSAGYHSDDRLFLPDQRDERQLQGVLSDRTLSLRAAASRDKEEQETREVVRYKVEELDRRKRQEEKRAERSKQDIELLLHKVPLTDNIFEELGVEDSEGEVIVDELVVQDREVELQVVKEVESNVEVEEENDSDWEDMDKVRIADEVTTNKYNTMSLKHFSRECERYGVSDRAGAKVGNALLKDLGIVKKGTTTLLICPSKLRRERCKWGEKLVQEHKHSKLPCGLYTDGKRVPTLVRQTNVTKVRVPGRRGRAAWRNVTNTSNTMVVEDHYPVLAQPGGQYVTHVTPSDGTGRALAQELVSVIKERQCDTRYPLKLF